MSWADIDATVVPVISVQRPLDPIGDTLHGLVIHGINGLPVIDFTQTTVGFVANSNYVAFENLVIRGANVGIEINETNAVTGAVVDHVEFVQQTTAAMRWNMTTPGGNGRFVAGHLKVTNVPSGLIVDETTANRTTFVFLEDSLMTGVTTGIEFRLGSGGSATYLLERLQVNASSNALRCVRPGGGSRALVLSGTVLQLASAVPFELEGTAAASSAVTLRMLDLRRTSVSGPALLVYPLGGQVSGDIDELRADGGVSVLSGGSGQLVFGNARLTGGVADFGSTGSVQLQILDSRFDGVTVTTQGTVPVQISASCLVGGSLQGSAQAPLQITGSFVASAVGANVGNTAPLPAPQLGSSVLVPLQPVLGGPVALQVDLPSGLFGVWAMGPTAIYPTIMARPIHVYMDLSGTVTLPGLWRLQQALQFTVPNNPLLVASDWTAQLVVLHDPGMQAPELSLPPGVRFVLR
jgi:hypothetical protein